MIHTGITRVNNAIVETTLEKDISGDENKRFCVNMQPLSLSQLYFLDELTSNLDSVTALNILRIFHSLAHGRSLEKAVPIVSLSKLTSKTKDYVNFEKYIFFLFRRKYFAQLGIHVHYIQNPADHLLHVITSPEIPKSKLIISLEQYAAINSSILIRMFHSND